MITGMELATATTASASSGDATVAFAEKVEELIPGADLAHEAR